MAKAQKKKLPSKKNSAKKKSSSEVSSNKKKTDQSAQKKKQSGASKKSAAKKSEVEDTKNTDLKKEKASKKKEGPSVKSEDAFPTEETKEEKDAVDEVTAIYYADDDGTRIDMTKMDQKKGKSKVVLFFFIVIALLGVISYLGYLVFNKDFGSTNGEVELSLTAEDRVASGDSVTLELEYLNGETVDISNGSIEILYPDGFHFQSADPETAGTSSNRWEIDRIKAGAGGKIRISGQLVGSKDEVKEFSARFTYQPENFSDDFQVTAQTAVTITSSIVDVQVDAPTQVQTDQEFTYSVDYTNTSSVSLSDVKILMEYPDDFTFSEASLEPWYGDNEWRIDEFEPGETQTLEITGSCDGESGETKEFSFQLGLIEIDNTFNVQIEKTALVVIVNPEVKLTVNAPDTVNPGEDVTVKVTVENISEVEMKEVDVQLSLSGALFDDQEHSFKKIKKLTPNESKEFTYQTTLKKKSKEQNQKLEIVATVVSAMVEGNEVSFPNQETVEMKVAGSFSVSAEGRYYDEDLTKLGSGPIPPEVGKETVYIIRWTIASGSNAMKDVSVQTTLPDHVIWENEASRAITWDSSTRQVTYSKDTVTANSNEVVEFAVRIAPTADDINKLLVLTKETVVFAIDKFTKEEVSEQLERITTDVPNDEGAKGKGVVERSSS